MSACPGTFCGSRVHQRPVLLHCLGCAEAAQFRAQLAQATAAREKYGRHRFVCGVCNAINCGYEQALADLPDALE